MKKIKISRFFRRLEGASRLGRILVRLGFITPATLQKAIYEQKKTGLPLGETLVGRGDLTRNTLRLALACQGVMRTAAFIAVLGMGMTQLGGAGAAATREARLDALLPAAFSLPYEQQDREVTGAPMTTALFGYEEQHSKNIRPFTKWVSMLSRFRQDMSAEEKAGSVAEWVGQLAAYKDLSVDEKIARVNKFVNARPYRPDQSNWAKSDYWATPAEFFRKGGDCEDFAIAKYFSLLYLGVPQDHMRLAIVFDKVENMPHALLIVYTDGGPVVLDNQSETVAAAAVLNRYKPIFSINTTGWWLHKEAAGTVVASAR